ncbi:DNA cytosine methyltransferase [Brucella intermedia]|uniref:DNA cytosine methyltransferase n=1 Tax=Brucella intermedia TaxID=94625 RepID=UPI00209B46BA|nr:DNA cytosine methyltransferase [Brucella intermedia]MCO7728645.1 DNA cytosine methyltransferase [Brucella intermedia]
MTAYYNEFDPKAAAWLRELIKTGHIAPGDVDERSIVDIRPSDLIGYTQCHFFAGIGVWPYALRRAGWPDDRPVWTGSCPCQPFSAAGKGAGFTDERHLWPHFHWLIENCRPPVVFGEQVASKDGLGWLDLVQADLEGSGYASGAVDTCAAGFGAPHIRQRLYWVAERIPNSNEIERGRRADCERLQPNGPTFRRIEGDCFIEPDLPVNGLVNSVSSGLEGQRSGHQTESGREGEVRPVAEASEFGGVAHNNDDGCSAPSISGFHNSEHHAEPRSSIVGRSSPTNGFWRDADWLFCRDGKWRPVEPGTFPLAHGAAARVGRLRGYGNAIVAPAAQAFIEAYLETEVAAANDNHCSVAASRCA